MRNSARGPMMLILFAALTAGAGNGISIVAFPWLVLQRTGSALDASFVAIAATLPLLVSTVIAGTAVDYLGRRRVSMISDALSAASVAAVPVIALAFSMHAVNVVVLAALVSRCCPRRRRAPVGRWTTPTASTRPSSTWPTSSDRG